MYNFTINQEVARLGSADVYGNKGTVVEINNETGRVRVLWVHTYINARTNEEHTESRRTWVAAKALAPAETVTEEMILNVRYQAALRDIKKWCKPSEVKPAIARLNEKYGK